MRLDGRPLKLRRVKERTLLAMLLLRVNQVVSLDHLAAGLWEDTETPRPPATLRVHVSRPRQALSPDGSAIDPVLITSGRGYSLQVPFESVDAWHFERLAAEGRRQLAADDPAGAAEAFSQALTLWRGQLLDDLTLSGRRTRRRSPRGSSPVGDRGQSGGRAGLWEPQRAGR